MPSLEKNKKWIFIVNPVAGGGKVMKQWASINSELLKADIVFQYRFSKKKMHITELVKEAIKNNFRKIVAVGGDGTAHEAINGIFQQNICPSSEITFGLLPIGTGNDWIKTHRIPKKLQQWTVCIKKEKTVFQDIGFIIFQKNEKNEKKEKRFFINVAGLSYDGYVAKKAVGQKTTFFNSLFYLKMMARCLFRYKIPELEILFNGQKKEGRLLTVNLGICRYSGGGMQLVPHAKPDDGKLAMTIAGKINPLAVLLVSPLFYLGKIGWHPKVDFYFATNVRINPLGNHPVYAEADGEFLGTAPAEIGIIPNALKIIVP
ncbi:MAG: diacylglycerol kinase family protein [Bacteroidota bacterium]